MKYKGLEFKVQENRNVNDKNGEIISYTFIYKDLLFKKISNPDLEESKETFINQLEGKEYYGGFIDKYVFDETYTYLMTDGRKYKIGLSIDPKKRLDSMKTANPDIRLICYSKNIPEKFLHDYFFGQRYKGEWFDLSKFDISIIKELFFTTREQSKLLMRICTPKTYKNNKDKAIAHYRNNFKLSFGKYKNIKFGEMLLEEHKNYFKWILANNFDSSIKEQAKLSLKNNF